ncbi:hypothetical protein FB451DRAFT_1299445 [Mycena latifolia]|nr:hypothetical protein FB451DRAFT_1299445 [Mycena latifolia]
MLHLPRAHHAQFPEVLLDCRAEACALVFFLFRVAVGCGDSSSRFVEGLEGHAPSPASQAMEVQHVSTPYPRHRHVVHIYILHGDSSIRTRPPALPRLGRAPVRRCVAVCWGVARGRAARASRARGGGRAMGRTGRERGRGRGGGVSARGVVPRVGRCRCTWRRSCFRRRRSWGSSRGGGPDGDGAGVGLSSVPLAFIPSSALGQARTP